MNDPFGHHSGQFANNHSEAENRQFADTFGRLTQEFATAMTEGHEASDTKVQDLVRRHYEFCLQFWTPNQHSYKALAMSYVLPSPYQEAYEEVAMGLAKFHYNAILIWADNNLSN